MFRGLPGHARNYNGKWISAHGHASDHAVQDSGRHAEHSILALTPTGLPIANDDDAGFIRE